jgi:hypothetical protein
MQARRAVGDSSCPTIETLTAWVLTFAFLDFVTHAIGARNR